MSDVQFILVQQDGTSFDGVDGASIVAVPAALDPEGITEYLGAIDPDDLWVVTTLRENEDGVWLETKDSNTNSKITMVVSGRPALDRLPTIPEPEEVPEP